MTQKLQILNCAITKAVVFLSPQIIAFTKEEMKKANLSEQSMISMIWTSLMSCVEWNKKEELVTEQAIKHLKVCKRSFKATIRSAPGLSNKLRTPPQ